MSMSNFHKNTAKIKTLRLGCVIRWLDWFLHTRYYYTAPQNDAKINTYQSRRKLLRPCPVEKVDFKLKGTVNRLLKLDTDVYVYTDRSLKVHTKMFEVTLLHGVEGVLLLPCLCLPPSQAICAPPSPSLSVLSFLSTFK